MDNEKTFTCWVCRKYPSVANNHNKVFVGTNKWHINYPIRHANDVKHANCIEKYLNEKHGTSQEIETGFQAATESVTTKRHVDTERLVRTAYMVVKEHLPFMKYTSMCKLQKLNGLELGENYLSDKACTRFVSSIASDLKSEVYRDIRNTRFVSILSDGSTDKGILGEIVYTRYIKHGRPVTNLIKVQLPDSVDAAGITKAIQEAINSLKPEDGPNDFMENFYPKLINVNFDGASVMSGHKSGVQKRLKDIQPGLMYTYCVAHRLELAMLDALKLKDDYLHRFDESINGLFKFYYYSPIWRNELKDMTPEIEVEFKQFLFA